MYKHLPSSFAYLQRKILSHYQEDPRRRNNFSLGLHAEISVHVVPQVESELKMAGDKNKNTIWTLL